MSKRCLGCMELFGDAFEICPHCGYVVGTPAEEAVHMEPGTLLYDRYIVGKVLGYGGFGVTYIGWDGKLEQKVAIKEYLPSEFSTRMPGQSQVTIFNGEKNEQFNDGLIKFVEEAKHLAKFQNERGIVKIFDSFKENDTAYIIMEYLDGETLTEYLRREKTIPEDIAVDMLMPVMESLQVVHESGLLHRDIAPDNIFLTTSGEVKLIDFGASRYATTSHSRSLTVIIKPGYSPEEQYRSRGDQGPHTDVYAIASTLYKMITGKTPPDAMERRAKYENQNKDILEEPHKINKNISLNRENAILNAMNVRIEDRTPDIATFIKELNTDPPAKRIYGKIKKIDIYSWPLWLKVFIPSILSIIFVFGILLLTGVINFSNFSEEIIIPDNVVTVPDVEGLYKDEALKLIADGKLLASTDGSVESEYIPAGKIILQTPVGGSYMDINGTVLLMISSGKGVASPENGFSVVPYVIWDTKEDAISKLLQAGLAEPDIVEEHDETVAYGSVISQSVEAGTQLDEGEKITLIISIGPAAFEMPNVVGESKENAENTLNSKGLVVIVEYKKIDSVAEGNVISQSVSAGSSVKRGDQITITVSSGRETVDVANVVGKSQSEAEKTLKNQGFKVTVLENYDANVAAGKVISQSPGAGTAQLPGSTIVIYVSKGKQPITVTFDANGGSVDTKSKSTYVSDVYGTLPTPTREGYTFVGWYSAKANGVEVEAKTVISTPSNHSLYAIWKANSYKVTFDANGGNETLASINVTFGTKYGEFGAVTRKGYTFDGWYTSASGGTKVTADTVYNLASNQTLYAHWNAESYKVTFDANGGSVSQTSKNVTSGDTYGTLPTPTRTGYTFNGWYTSASGGTKVTSSTSVNITSAQTLYAQWSVGSYTVSFNANGGSVSQTSKSVTYGETYGILPTPTRTGYTFNGWYTSASGGTKITSSTSVSITSGQTLYAQWSKVVVTNVSIYSLPSKTTYYQGDAFTAEGLIIAISYSDGTVSYGSYTDCSISTPDMTNSGTKTVTVSYGGVGTTYTITIRSLTVSLSIDESNVTSGYIMLNANISAGYISWNSSNTAVATVDSNGKVTLKNNIGTTTITATVTNGSCSVYATKNITISNTSGTKFKETTSVSTSTVLFATRPQGYSTALPTTGTIPTYSVNSADVTGSTVTTNTGKVVTSFVNNGVNGYVYYQFNYSSTGGADNTNKIIYWQEGWRYVQTTSQNFKFHTTYGCQFYSTTNYPEHQAEKNWTQYYAIWWAYRDKQEGHTWYVASGITGARAASWYRFPIYSYSKTVTTYTNWCYSVN